MEKGSEKSYHMNVESKKIWKLTAFFRSGQEELLPEEVYLAANCGLWIEGEGDVKRVIFYTNEPSFLLSVLKEKTEMLNFYIEQEPILDYESLFKRFFRPIRIGQIYIVAPWNRKVPNRTYLTIEPGAAFGTGRHESTKLMILIMGGIDFNSKKVVDLGCGSGILSIYASTLGAKKVLAIDNDEEACSSAKKNLILNGIKNVKVEKRDISETKGKFDIVLANLEISIFSKHMASILGLLKRRGKLLASGIKKSEKKIFLSLAEKMRIIEEKSLRSWIAFVAEKP